VDDVIWSATVKAKTFFLMLYLFSCAAYGDVYQWTDENGRVHFGNIPPVPQKKYLLGDGFSPMRKVAMPLTNNAAATADSLEQETPVKRQRVPAKNAAPILAPKGGLNKSATKIENAAEKAMPAKTKEMVGEKTDIKGNATLKGVKKSASTKIPKAKQKALKPGKATGVKASSHKKLKAAEAKKAGAKKAVVKEGKDPDKCGLFRDFVEQYTIKKNEGCPGSACEVYKRQLEKYKAKAQHYC
jgi:hypothetical protein